MSFDFTLTLSILVTAALTAGGAWIATRVTLALTEKRAKEAFDIAVATRDALHRHELDQARSSATIAHVDAIRAEFVAGMAAFRGEVREELHGIRDAVIEALAEPRRKPRSLGAAAPDA